MGGSALNSQLDLNPLTGLPGNRTIRRELETTVIQQDGVAAFLDITGFKPFNDHYGLSLGDSVIRRLGEILHYSVQPFFTGHVGGDDFVCAGHGQDFRDRVERARLEFRAVSPGFYKNRDREAGGIETFDRYGGYRFFPFLDLTVVMLTRAKPEESVENLCQRACVEKERVRGVPVPGKLSPLLDTSGFVGMSERDVKAYLEAAGILRESEAVPSVRKVLEGDFSWNIRKSAALSLGRIGGEEAVKALLEALGDSSPHVRTRAVEGLVLAWGSKAGSHVAELARDPSTWVRRAVFRGMGRTGWRAGLPVLYKAAAGSSVNSRNTIPERTAALEGIALIGDPDSAAFLAGLCGNQNYQPGGDAFRALCAVGGDQAAAEVLKRGVIPENIRLEGVSPACLSGLEKLALSIPERKGLRLLAGFPGELSATSRTTLRRWLGCTGGDLFLQLVGLLEAKAIPADASCAARVSARLERGDNSLDTHSISRFLVWLSHSPGIPPGVFLKPFLRMTSGQVRFAAATALSMLGRGLTAEHSEKSFQD